MTYNLFINIIILGLGKIYIKIILCFTTFGKYGSINIGLAYCKLLELNTYYLKSLIVLKGISIA